LAARSFDLFDTLVTRRCVDPHKIFDSVERVSGRAGFARARCAAEVEISSGQYTLDDIYRRLAEHHGIPTDEADQLKKLELETEAANLFPIREHCREVGPYDAVVSDMYLPVEWLDGIVHKICGVAPRRLYVSSHGKRNGTVWGTIRETMTITEHVGDNPVTDQASAQAAGIPVRLATVARRSEIEHKLAAAGFSPLSNLIREARLTTWHDDPALRRAQIAQVQINFPLLFLATLHLRKLCAVQGWDHILMSGRNCYLWHDLYQCMRHLLPDAPTATYFYTSRVSSAHPSPSYLAYFAEQCVGRHNVVVDMCGTGWSLTRLIEAAPKLSVELFVLHKLERADWVRKYEKFGTLTAPIAVHSIVARPPKASDHKALELLNFAPHASVMDVNRVRDGFQPVFSSVNYSGHLAGLIRVHHHAAFMHAIGLLRSLTAADMAAMLNKDTVLAIEATFSTASGMLPEFAAFTEYSNQEERQVLKTLQDASLVERKCS
jgi:hypothetical protein